VVVAVVGPGSRTAGEVVVVEAGSRTAGEVVVAVVEAGSRTAGVVVGPGSRPAGEVVVGPGSRTAGVVVGPGSRPAEAEAIRLREAREGEGEGVAGRRGHSVHPGARFAATRPDHRESAPPTDRW
jgi:hypothetical protein